MPTLDASHEARPFAKRHAKMLTFVGALIVFTTYVIKDFYHEKWDSTAKALDTARIIYILRTGTNPGEQHRLQYLIGHAHDLDFSDAETLIQADADEGNEMRAIYLQLESLTELANKLPENSPNRKALADLRETQDPLFLRVRSAGGVEPVQDTDGAVSPGRNGKLARAKSCPNDLYTDCEGDSPALLKKKAPYMKRQLAETESRAYEETDRALRHLEDDAWKVTQNILEEAEALRKANERAASIASVLSTVFYVLGWGLGLLVKLQGGGDAIGAE